MPVPAPALPPTPAPPAPTTLHPEAAALDRTLHVQPWDDPVIDEGGHDPRSPYVERFWLPVLGPSTTWLLRRLVDGFDGHPEGYDLRLSRLAGELGLALRHSRPSPLLRSLERACTFGTARQLGEATLAVRRHLAPLSRRQLARLPEHLRHQHDGWVATTVPPPATTTAADVAALRTRARSLALSLLELGETPEATERQLHRWRFHPAMAHDALRWAAARAEPSSTPPTPAAPSGDV